LFGQNQQSATEILLQLEGGSQALIPITLPAELDAGESFSNLTVGAFWFPEYFVGSWTELGRMIFRSSGQVVNYELNYGANQSPTLLVPPVEALAEANFGGFAIHANSQPPGDGSLWHFAAPHVVTRGEEFELTFFANSHPLGDYVIISMLDWQQIPMNNQPFLWVTPSNNADNLGQYATFTVTAPEAAGFYEFLAFLVPTPTSRMSAASHVPLEQVRFTLQVTE